jgi:hypothetical protein
MIDDYEAIALSHLVWGGNLSQELKLESPCFQYTHTIYEHVATGGQGCHNGRRRNHGTSDALPQQLQTTLTPTLIDVVLKRKRGRTQGDSSLLCADEVLSFFALFSMTNVLPT